MTRPWVLVWWPGLVRFDRNIEFCFYKQHRPQSTMILRAEAEDLPSLRCQHPTTHLIISLVYFEYLESMCGLDSTRLVGCSSHV